MEDKDRILQILNGFGLKGQVNEQGFVRNQTKTKTALLHDKKS